MSDTAVAAPTAARTAGTPAVTWFEIPVRDFARALGFYEALVGAPLRVGDFLGQRMAVFPYEAPGVGGCIAEAEHPTPHGTIVYLNVDGRLDAALAAAVGAGGRVESPKTELSNGIGWSAHVIDSEGNRVGLHAITP